MSLRLEEFSDLELLAALIEHADDEGQISSAELADALGLSGLKHPRRNVAIRLSWLKRYGVLYRDETTQKWGLTPVGETLINGNLRAAERRLLEGLDQGKLYAVIREVSRSMVEAHDEAATMAARQWRHGMAQRKARWR